MNSPSSEDDWSGASAFHAQDHSSSSESEDSTNDRDPFARAKYGKLFYFSDEDHNTLDEHHHQEQQQQQQQQDLDSDGSIHKHKRRKPSKLKQQVGNICAKEEQEQADVYELVVEEVDESDDEDGSDWESAEGRLKQRKVDVDDEPEEQAMEQEIAHQRMVDSAQEEEIGNESEDDGEENGEEEVDFQLELDEEKTTESEIRNADLESSDEDECWRSPSSEEEEEDDDEGKSQLPSTSLAKMSAVTSDSVSKTTPYSRELWRKNILDQVQAVVKGIKRKRKAKS